MYAYRYVLAHKDENFTDALESFLSGFGIVYYTRRMAKLEAKPYGLKVFKIKIGVIKCVK